MYWLTGLLGLMLGIAPFVLGYRDHTYAMWSSVILGAIVLLVSAYKAVDNRPTNWEYWVAGLAGLLAVIAPFALGFSTLTSALWTTIVLGVILLVLAAYEVFYRQNRTALGSGERNPAS